MEIGQFNKGRVSWETIW